MNVLIKLSREENLSKYNATEVTLDFEEYLKGVVPAEIGNSALEACKAQAVAARTFALYRQIHRGYMTDKSSTDQAFRASRISSSYPNAMQAVEETAGEVLYYNGKLVETCVYSASNGGQIKSSEEVWGGKRGYLVSKPDPYDTKTKNGHAVGMSQTGAKEMARQGFSYKDILAFYYPGTEIRKNYGEDKEVIPVAEKTNAQIVKEWAESKLNPQCGYIWGTAGQKCTQALIDSKHAQYPDHVDPSIVKKWIGMQVFDCQGFVQQAMKQIGIQMVSGATSQWNKTQFAAKGTIDTLPQDKVCCLYRKDASTGKMGHTGLYIGNGEFIHAAGSKTGVVKSTIKAYGRWTHWGIPAGLYDNGENIIITISNLKRGSYGAGVKLLQEMLLAVGEALPKYGTDSDFGSETELALQQFQKKHQIAPTGIVDATTEKLLYELSKTEAPSTEPDPEEGDREIEVIPVVYQAKVQAKTGSSVNMRADTSKSSSVITKIATGQIVDVTSVIGEWSAIIWNDKAGFMMNEFLVKVDGSDTNNKWYVRIECDSETQAKAIASILAKAKATT